MSHANLSVLINIVVYQRDRDRLWCDTLASLPGIKVDRDIWQLLCSPSVLRSFATGYFWKPYEGEVYKPLVTSSELKTKMSDSNGEESLMEPSIEGIDRDLDDDELND